MRKIQLLLLIIVFASTAKAQNNIAEARTMVGKNITVTGIVTNGTELGAIRYIQDETGGIAAYSSSMLQNVVSGDKITISGTLKDYNCLLEIDPVTTVTVVSKVNTVPEPKVITPAEIGEAYEAQLIRINGVTFTNGGSVFEGNKNYNFLDENNKSGTLRVNKLTTSIVGQMIPAGPIDIVTICSQFSYTANDIVTGYQLLPRSMDDFIMEGAIQFNSPLFVSNLSKTAFTLSWTTDVTGTSEVFYGAGSDPATWTQKAIGTVAETSNGFQHTVDLNNLQPGNIVFVKAFSVHNTDTASTNKVFATVSNSSGNVEVYFNTEVDNSYSKGVDAIYLNKAIDDTLISYINRATESIDFTIYSFDNSNISNISKALNAARKRGVKIRLIACGTVNNLALNDLDPEVPKLKSPGEGERDGIMHNKFVVFDAHSSEPNVPLVWTGATNFTDGQINIDPNNVIIIQDQSLALTYEIEFEEMWGSETEVPSPDNARFGVFKKDNTPHNFIIGGKQMECYFSPSDGTNQQILNAIATADHDLSIATMLITRTDLAYSISDAKKRGVGVNILTNSVDDNTVAVNEILTASVGAQHFVYDNYVQGIMHHKYAVIDQELPNSDPTVITGSHNWSASANDRNDENTLIIHDETIANIYFQQFAKIFTDNHGSFVEISNPPVAFTDTVLLMKNEKVTISVLRNDTYESAVELSIEQQAAHGNAYIPFTNQLVINYLPTTDYTGVDTIRYKITYLSDNKLSAVGTILLQIGSVGIDELENNLSIVIYPNPVTDRLHIASTNNIVSYTIYRTNGQAISANQHVKSKSITVDLSDFSKELYLIKLNDEEGNTLIKKFRLQ